MNKIRTTGVKEFPISIDFFDNPKICALTVEHGIKGQAAVIMLLYAIYRNGYYIEWTQDNCVVLLKELPGIKIAKMQKIVETLVEWEFFDRELFEKHQVLTSRDIQKHYKASQDGNLSNEGALPYWLIESYPANASEMFDRVLKDQPKVEKICKNNNIDSTELKRWKEMFVIECKEAGKDSYNDMDSFMNVLNYWILNVQIPKEQG